MSEDDTQTTAESEARGAELRENVALTDARRAEEEVARAQAVVDAFVANPGAGVLTLDGKMIDRPHLIKAQALLARC